MFWSFGKDKRLEVKLMSKNSLCSMPDWVNLNVSSNGEAVLCYQDDNTFIMTKVRTLPQSASEIAIESSYQKRLGAEAKFTCEAVKAFQCKDAYWHAHVFAIDSDMTKYTMLAYALIEGYYCIIEANFLTFEDYSGFVQLFEQFSSSVDFKQLRRSAGVLKFDNHEASVSGISDIKLQDSGCEETLLFVSKNKYFSVNVSESSQHDNLMRALSEYNYTYLLQEDKDGVTSERFRLFKEGKPSGTVELSTMLVDKYKFEVLGYWLGETEERISDNLSITIK